MEQDQSKILLVEGPEDKKVIAEILRASGIDLIIKPCGGCNQLFDQLPLYLSNPGQYKTIGVVLDADANPEGRLQRFEQILNENGRYGRDGIVRFADEGLIIDGNDANAARVGLWMMPDNQSHGMLEDFLDRLAVAACPQLMEEAERAVATIERKKVHRYTPAHRSKARIHTYLAWKKEPGRSLACAVSKHYFDVSSENARSFVGWTMRLFE